MFHLFEQGLYYPSTGRHPRAHVQHVLVSDAFTKAPSSQGDFAFANGVNSKTVTDMLLHEMDIADRHTNIISSESLCLLNDESVQRFGQVFADYDIRPIVYLRNMVDLADASYQTQVMSNAAPKSTRVEDSGFAHWPAVLDLYGRCKRWASISGNGKIIARDFEQSKSRGIVPDFCAVVGIDTTKTDNTYLNSNLNKSLSMSRVLLRHKLFSLDVNPVGVEGKILAEYGDSSGSYIPAILQGEMHRSYLDQLKRLSEENLVDHANLNLDVPFVEKKYIGNLYDGLEDKIEQYRK
ncbi:MAG: hypothetical protein ACRCU5_05820 [Rhizobiaceae bacterium]